MCGIIPFDHCADSRVSSSTTARSTLSGANPTATNAASQLHMCGYSSGAAVVITPRSLPRSRYAARAASCVGEKLGSGAIDSMMRPRRRARPPRRQRVQFADNVAGMQTALITGASGALVSPIASALSPTHTLLLAGRPSRRLSDLAERVGGTVLDMDLTESNTGAAGGVYGPRHTARGA